MSSTVVLGFIKDITAKNIKAVSDRLKKKEKPDQRYVDPKQQGYSYTLLHKAVQVGSPEIVTALLKAGADVNSRDSKGRTCLHWLSSLNTAAHVQVAELVLQHKLIDVNIAADDKSTALHESATQGNDTLARLLIEKAKAQPDDSSPGATPLHAACKAGFGPGSPDSKGFTPLMRLLQKKMWQQAGQLLARGDSCNINAKGSNQETALLIAVAAPNPDLQLVGDLLAAGAAIGVQDAAGNTPLLTAVQAGEPAGLKLAEVLTLFATKASKSEGSTCASDALAVDAVNAAGESALSLSIAAVRQAQGRDSARQMQLHGAEVQLLGLVLQQQPQLPTQLASSLLLQGLKGQLPDAITAQVITLLPDLRSVPGVPHESLSFGSLLSSRLYKSAAAVLCKASSQTPGDPQDALGNTHLHVAVSGSEDVPELVTALLAIGVPADATNKDGDTALHIAARAGHVGACRALVAGGAHVTWRNNKNRIPGNQLKLPDATKSFLQEAEAAAKAAKEQKNHELWDAKMRATQTDSAFGIGVT
eukprot:gene12339-12472_t